MPSTNYYQVLEINIKASQQEIKQAYRRLAKIYHPDKNQAQDTEKIISINTAYEILKDPKRRRLYDQELRTGDPDIASRQNRAAQAQEFYQRDRQAQYQTEQAARLWFKQVFNPCDRLINAIINPLKREIDALAADPFDDELMANFTAYLEKCSKNLEKAEIKFTSFPSPSHLASVSANLSRSLNQIGDGIKELEWFTMNYDEHYLHTGKEIFRIAKKLQQEVKRAAKSY